MSKLNKGLTITAVTAALAGSIGFAYAQSSSTGQGSAANPNATTTNGTVNTPTNSGMSPTMDNRANSVNSQNNGSTNLEQNTGARANDGLNNMPATSAGTNEAAAPAPVITPDRPPRADRN